MWASNALAQGPHPVEQAWFRDDTGQRSLEDVRQQTFTPYSGMLARGFDAKAVYWVKLRIPASEVASGPWVLRIQPAWHDDLRLFDPADPHTALRATGDRYPWAASEFLSLGNAFLLQSTPTARDVYVRVQSKHSYQLDVELLGVQAAERSEWQRVIVLSIYITAMTLVLLWALSVLLLRRDRTVAVFALTQTAALLYSLLMFGMGRVLLDGWVASAWLDNAHAVVVMAYTFTSVLFYSLLLRDSGASRWANAVLGVLTLMPVVALALYLAGYATQALSLNSLNVLSFSLLAFAIAWLGLRGQPSSAALLPRWGLRIFLTLILLIGLWGALPLLGLVKASAVSLLIFLLHGPVLTTVLGALLVFRSRQRVMEQARQVALATARAEQERLAREEQSQFMAMINHEIKNPLAVLKLLLAGQPIQGRAEAQVDTVVALLERCLMYDQLNAGQGQRSTEVMQPGLIVQQCIDRTGVPSRFVATLASAQRVQSDPLLYSVIVGNLLDNALKYAPRDSSIAVDLHDAEHNGRPCVCLSVSNTIGRAGTPDPDRMFDKYYRAEGARSTPGTGLGLYLVKSFAAMLGGSVTCTVQPPNIRFEVCLPL